MVSAKKQAEGMAFLAALLAETGKAETTADDLLDEVSTGTQKQERRRNQSEGVLLFLETAGKAFLTKKCKECGQPFATRYTNVAYCGDLCRAAYMRKAYNIRWDPTRDHYAMMEAERPLLVGPAAYQVLQEFARRILEEDILVLQDDPQEDNPLPQEPPEADLPDPLASLLEQDHTSPLPSLAEEIVHERSDPQPPDFPVFDVQW